MYCRHWKAIFVKSEDSLTHFNSLQCKTRGRCLCLPVCCTWSLLRQPFYSSEEFLVKSPHVVSMRLLLSHKYSTMRLTVPVKRSNIKMEIGYRWAEMFLLEILCLQQGCLFYLFTQNINFLTHHPYSVASIREILKSDFWCLQNPFSKNPTALFSHPVWENLCTCFKLLHYFPVSWKWFSLKKTF